MIEAKKVLNDRHDPRDRVPEHGELAALASVPLGTLHVDLAIGALRLRLEGLDAATQRLVLGHYDGFVAGSAGPEAPEFRRMRVTRSPESRWLYLPRAEGKSEEARMGARSEGSRLELWSYFFAASFDRDARAGTLWLCDAAEADVSQAIENTLRFFVAAAALSAGGFLLHSAGVARHGRSWLFFGPSGAGKSTTASNAPPDAELLGDDLILVERNDEGYRACGVPFRGSFARGRNAAACAPLAMACRLFQSSDNRLSDVPRSVQAAEVLGELPFLMDDPTLRDRAAERVEAFVRAVSVRRLHLRRDGSYWNLLEP